MTGPVSVPPGSSPVVPVPTGVDFFAQRYLALLAERDALASELAGVRVELERTEGDWAVAIREATRARAALAGKQDACTKGATWLMRIVRELRELHFDLPHVLLTDEGVPEPGTTFLDELFLVAQSLDFAAALSVAVTDTEETP